MKRRALRPRQTSAVAAAREGLPSGHKALREHLRSVAVASVLASELSRSRAKQRNVRPSSAVIVQVKTSDQLGAAAKALRLKVYSRASLGLSSHPLLSLTSFLGLCFGRSTCHQLVKNDEIGLSMNFSYKSPHLPLLRPVNRSLSSTAERRAPKPGESALLIVSDSAPRFPVSLSARLASFLSLPTC